MRKRIIANLIIFLCLFGLFAGGWKRVVFAGSEASVQQFSGNINMLKKDNDNYVMQVTVGNEGEDFAGTVQVIFQVSKWDNCAYNTEIDLPAQGKKQFTVTVSERAVDTVRGMCVLNFLDGKGKLVQSISLKNVFGNTVSNIPVGILSDDSSALSFMDAGGRDYSIRDMSYPLKMIELSSDNLENYLDGLYFLIIDRFNVSSLSEDQIQAIQKWVEEGGWLLLGTGAYAEQTLSGFDKDFLGVEVLNVSEPGEENDASENADQYGYYYDYIDEEIDLTQMAISELDYDNYSYYESTGNPAICGAIGDGSVSVFYFSFGEEELQKLQDYMILNMYDEALYRSNSYQNYGGYSDMDYSGQLLLSYIDSENTKLDFTWLEALIGIYVILVGPVLYLILRKCKKSEWYWIGVPVLGLTFIVGVFFFGQGSKVNETKVYSITAQRTDSNQADTYFLAYHSGIKEWDIRLNDSYETAGPGWTGYGYYSGSTYNSNDYHYVVNSDSKGLSVGLKPQENFESGYFYAMGKTENKGNFSGTDIEDFRPSGDPEGTIVNETGYDMAYLGVWYQSYLMIFSDVKAGETLDIEQAIRDGRCLYEEEVTYFDNLIYDLVSIYGSRTSKTYEQDDMSALLIGLGIADEAKPSDRPYAIVAGVVKDYNKVMAGRCNETSYGCLYSYVEMEGKEDASY